MKAKLSGNSITLQNGVKFLATEGETEEKFINRVTEAIDRDYCDELIIEAGDSPYSDHESVSVGEQIPESSGTPQSDDPHSNVGKMCSFPTQRTSEMVTGRIIWVYNDKRKNLLYYRVRDNKGKIHIKRINSKTLTIHENN